MFRKYLPLTFFIAALPHISLAQLPVLDDDEWTGYYAGSKNRKAFFGITQNTDCVFHVLDDEGAILRSSNPVKLYMRVIEADATGKLTRKTIDATSLSSNAEAEANPKLPFIINGKVTGNATFQSTVKIIPVGLNISGKITSPGEIKSPVIFGIDIDLDPYQGVDLNDKEKRKENDRMLRRDKLEITTLDGQVKRYKMDQEFNFSSDFPDGVSSISLQSERYENVEYVITASKGSAIHFAGNARTPVYKSLELLWKPNKDADPAAESLTMIAD